MKKLFIQTCVIALAAAAFVGCTTQSKSTKQAAFTKAGIVKTPHAVVYPVDYVTVTNGAGQTMTYAKYAALEITNDEPFSLAGLFAGYDELLPAFTDAAKESHSGTGKALLADSQYTQLTSDFTSGARFSGSSSLQLGSLSLVINTNAITATGNAGSQVIQGIGAAAGQIINKGVTGQ